MSNFTDTAWVWAAKGAGAVAGSAVSLAYMLPKGRREAVVRFVVGLICGLTFGGATGIKIATELEIGAELGEAELMLMGSAAASLAAWSALGILARFAERLQGESNSSRSFPSDSNQKESEQ